MRGLHKLTGAANTMQAREDYRQLVRLAGQIGRPELVTPEDAVIGAGWRSIDEAAIVGCENILRERPDLRKVLERIYPGLEGRI